MSCWHAHRKMRGTAVIFKPLAGPPLCASVIVPECFESIDKQTDKKLQTSGVKWAEMWRILGLCLIMNPQEKREQNKQTINTICTNIYLYRQHRVELWVAYVNLVLLLAGVAAWVGGWPAWLLSVWSAGCLRTCFWSFRLQIGSRRWNWEFFLRCKLIWFTLTRAPDNACNGVQKTWSSLELYQVQFNLPWAVLSWIQIQHIGRWVNAWLC